MILIPKGTTSTSDPPPEHQTRPQNSIIFQKATIPPPTPGKLFFSLKNVPIIPSIISIFITDKQVKFLSQKALQWLIPPPLPPPTPKFDLFSQNVPTHNIEHLSRLFWSIINCYYYPKRCHKCNRPPPTPQSRLFLKTRV